LALEHGIDRVNGKYGGLVFSEKWYHGAEGIYEYCSKN
jgi:hypothetical protein